MVKRLIILLSLFIFFSPLPGNAFQGETARTAYTQVQGTITSQNEGIRDVRISDGKNIFLSDQNGDFEFLTDQPLVFIT